MRAVLLGVALTLVAGPAWAQSCTTYGTKTICDNGFTAQRVGKTTTFSDGTMAFRSGNMTMYRHIVVSRWKYYHLQQWSDRA